MNTNMFDAETSIATNKPKNRKKIAKARVEPNSSCGHCASPVLRITGPIGNEMVVENDIRGPLVVRKINERLTLEFYDRDHVVKGDIRCASHFATCVSSEIWIKRPA